MSFQEELDMLAAIYCGKGEFSVASHSSNCRFTINLTTEESPISLTFSIPPEYPALIPSVHILQPFIKRQAQADLHLALSSYLNEVELLGQPMLCSVVDWVKSHVLDYFNEDKVNLHSANDSRYSYLMQLDHMRSKAKYIKQLRLWSKELDLSGLLLFLQRFIFIIIHGSQSDVKEFISRLRNRNIDVDSSGHPCKERMLKILNQTKDENCALEGFHIHELSTKEELQTLLERQQLQKTFSQLVDYLPS